MQLSPEWTQPRTATAAINLATLLGSLATERLSIWERSVTPTSHDMEVLSRPAGNPQLSQVHSPGPSHDRSVHC